MKNKLTLQQYLMLFLAVILIVSLVANYIQYHNISTAKQNLQASNAVIKTAITDLKVHTDSAGNQHVSFNSNENVINKATAAYSKTLDTVARAIGQKKNDITDIGQVTASIAVKHLPGIKSDSAGVRRYRLTDKTFDAMFTEPRPGIDTNGIFDLKANITLNYASYRRRAWFLAALKQYTDIYATDPRVTIGGLKRLVIEQPDPSFGLRIRASATYNPELQSVSAGPEAAFDFGRNQFRVNYFYNIQNNQWRPTFTISHDFIRF